MLKNYVSVFYRIFKFAKCFVSCIYRCIVLIKIYKDLYGKWLKKSAVMNFKLQCFTAF